MLSKIADDICARGGKRLVLVAGGSSAGKTTTAKRLATQIMVNDHAVVHLSTDDYFVGDARNPRDENGELDYEHVECVDMKKLAEDVNALMNGAAVRERRFDFVRHEPYELERTFSLAEGGFVIIEGIHALNPRLTDEIPDDAKYRVFVEPNPTLDVFAGITPKSTDIRFLRRMVRDNQFRKMNPATTVGIWPKVLAGEDKWINPFRGNADATFDSYLEYELAVLKPYVGGLLERARIELGAVPQVMNMIRLMAAVVATFPDAVPGDSIIRETIGGSQLEY
jgi:uridine kinase